MIIEYVPFIPLWITSDNKRLSLDGLNFTKDTTNFSNVQFINLDTLIITRKSNTNENLYIKIGSHTSAHNNINSSVKANPYSYWYTVNTEAVSNGVYVYTLKLDYWATYCIDLINLNSDIPLLHKRSHLHTLNSKFAEDYLYDSVQKTVIGNKVFGRKIDSGWYTYPREFLRNATNLVYSTNGTALPQNNPSSNDIFYVFRDKTSGGYKCFPLLDFKVSVETTTNPQFKSAFSLSYVCAINVYDSSDKLVSTFNGSTSLPDNKRAMVKLYANSNSNNWYDRKTDSDYGCYSSQNPRGNWKWGYVDSPSTFKKSNCYFFIQNGDTREIDIESASNINLNFVLYQNAIKFKHPVRNYEDIVLNVKKRGEFDILEYTLNSHVVYRRQIPTTNSISYGSYINHAWILLSWTKIPGTSTKLLQNNNATTLNNLINNVNFINDFVGIYKWVPYNTLNDDNYTTQTVSLNGSNVELIYYLLDKNGTYLNGAQYLDGGYMDMFPDKARIPTLNVKNYVMSWNARVAMETKWWNNVIDPRIHFGTYGNNNEKTSMNIFGYMSFNEAGFKWTKSSDYAFSENITLQLPGQLVSATSEYKQYISSQLSTLETGYNLQKEQTNLNKAQNNFNSVFNSLSSMTNAVIAPFQAFGKLITGDVGSAMGKMGAGINAQYDFYRNIGNTIYNNKQSDLDLKKVKDTTIANVTDKFRSSTNLMTQSSIKDIVLSSSTLYQSGIWFNQQVLAKSTIMGYNNINVMYGFVNNDYLKLSQTIYKSTSEKKLSWIELDREDVITKLSQYINMNIPNEFQSQVIDILTSGFRIWSGTYSSYGEWDYAQ